MGQSKYKVSDKKAKRTYNGIVFDSELEMKYYRDVIMPDFMKGLIKAYSIQPKYKIQDSFEKYGRKFQAIYYVADFEIWFVSGDTLVVDVKGLPTEAAKLKRKLFDKKYHDKILQWTTYAKKYGGWLQYDELVKKRAADKRQSKKGVEC